MIELIGVQKRFGSVRVADRLDFTFPRGRVVALLGRNGAGKSTLLRMIAGNLRPDAGQIRVVGSVSWPVGFAGSFHGDMSGAQNIRYIARIYGVDTDALCQFVEDFAELGRQFHAPVRGYSSGMRARLAFGASMGIQFDTYLIDEVTSVGDAAFRSRSADMLEARLAESGAIVVSHGKGMLRRLCDSAVLLENGRLRWFDDLELGLDAHAEQLAA